MSLFLSLAIPTFVGFLLVSLLLSGGSGASRIERVVLGFGAGLGLLAFETFLLGWVGITYTLLNIFIAQLLSSVVLLLLLRRRGTLSAAFASPQLSGVQIRPLRTPLSGLAIAALSVIVVWLLWKAGFVISENLLYPLHTGDTWSNWSSGAKFFYTEQGLLLDRAHENFFGEGYRLFLGHPLHTPLLQVWIALWLGEFHEVYVKAWAAFYYIGVLALLYFALRRETSPLYSVVWVFILASSPLLTYHATEGMADLPLTFFVFASLIYLWRYIKDGGTGVLVLSSVFLAMAIFTKNEGLFYFIATGGALLLAVILRHRRIGELALPFILPFAVLVGPWLVFKLVYGIGYGHSGEGSELVWLSDPKAAAGAARSVHWEIFPAAFSEVFIKTSNFSLVIPFWIIASLVALPTIIRGELKYLYVVILAVICAFFFVYLTLELTAVIHGTGIHRNIMGYFPALVFTSALAIRGFLVCEGSCPERGGGD